MAAVIIPSDFGAQENKICHCFHCFPIYLPWSDGTRCHDFSFLNMEFWPAFSLSSFVFIKRLFSSSLLSAIRVVSSEYLRLDIGWKMKSSGTWVVFTILFMSDNSFYVEAWWELICLFISNFLKYKYFKIIEVIGTSQWLSCKESICNAGDSGDVGLTLGLGRSLEEEMTTHSSILAWRTPWTEEPGGLQSMGSQRVGYNWVSKHTYTHKCY